MRLPLERRLALLGLALVLAILAFMVIDVNGAWAYALPRRGRMVAAMLLVGGSVGASTVIFQTLTNNRILTPGVIGLDALYQMLQTVLVFAFGSTTLTLMDRHVHFLISVGFMVVFALALHHLLFRRAERPIHFLLLVGLICGVLFQSFASFMQVLIDPNEYLFIQDRLFASFNNVRSDLLWACLAAMLAVGIYSRPLLKYLDVLALGRDQALNLGVDYDRVVKRLMVVVAVLVSLATSLVGPITFLGLLVANLAYELMGTYRHGYLLAAATLTGGLAVVGGQALVEHLLTFSTTLSVVVNFLGGGYFLYLVLRERTI